MRTAVACWEEAQTVGMDEGGDGPRSGQCRALGAWAARWWGAAAKAVNGCWKVWEEYCVEGDEDGEGSGNEEGSGGVEDGGGGGGCRRYRDQAADVGDHGAAGVGK